MISSHADSEAYQFLLETLQDAIRRLADDLVSKSRSMKYDGERSRKLLEYRVMEAQEDGFSPMFMMIDGDDAERLAIEVVFPGTPIRMCQFHFMQACRSRARNVFGHSKEGNRKTHEFLKRLRRCQRCPISTEWPRYYEDLQQDIDFIAKDGGEARARLVSYLDRQWFSDLWLPYCVDFGIPAWMTRDGPWSTNNYAEAAFRTFDRVFLSCRVNKR